MSCKRNAFMMLIHADQDRALNYLSSCIDQVPTFGDILQLVIVELIYKVSGRSDVLHFSQFLTVHISTVTLSEPIDYSSADETNDNSIDCDPYIQVTFTAIH